MDAAINPLIVTHKAIMPPINRFLGLTLSEGITRLNMIAFYWACMLGILLSTFLPQMQPLLLSEFLFIPKAEQGAISGNLSFWGEIAVIASVGIWGPVSDRIGRRPVMATAFLLMAFSTALSARATEYMHLFEARLVFGLGVAAFSCMVGALVADYVCNESRGKGAGYLGMSNGFGAMITVLFLLKLPFILNNNLGFDLKTSTILTYDSVVAITILSAVFMWFGLSKKQSHSEEKSEGFLILARDGILAAKDHGIALAYGASFVARGNLVVVGTFFTLWLSQYGVNELGLSSTEALSKAGTMIAIAQGCALLGAPLFGIMADKFDRVWAMILTLAISALGYSATIFVDNPFGGFMIGCAILIGLGEVGCIISSSVLIAQQAPKRIRGAVLGFFNLTGALGIMFASKVGGSLYDSWTEAAPFVIFGAFATLVLVWALLVRNKIKPLQEADDTENALPA
jgi:MFS family permease